jgi:hypothetical protein
MSQFDFSPIINAIPSKINIWIHNLLFGDILNFIFIVLIFTILYRTIGKNKYLKKILNYFYGLF